MLYKQCLLFSQSTEADTVQIIQSNVDQVLAGHELVFLNFYADWCRFSQMLKPVFEDAGKKVREAYPEQGKVAFAKVDCDKETAICQKFSVSKYPTLKIFRNGAVVKREYRGQRTGDALADFVKKQLIDPVQKVDDMEVFDSLDRKKRHIIGFFETDQTPDYHTFTKVASMLQDDCKFYTAIGEVSQDDRLGGNKVLYKPPGENSNDMTYSGRLSEYNIMLQWTTDKCVPLVREITFENAEELTEEGLPFMILFHSQDDTETPETFRKQVAVDLLSEKSSINFLVADGQKFTHPLYHLGKSNKDLPIIAIDSFRHMYLWNMNAKTDINKPGLLRQFIKDLHSGKLHRDFHNPPAAIAGDLNTQNGGMGNVIGGGLGAGGDGQFHLDISQQVITNDQGFRIQVLKINQHEGAVHLDEIKQDLEKIEAKTEKEIEAKEKGDRGEGQTAEEGQDKENFNKDEQVVPGGGDDKKDAGDFVMNINNKESTTTTVGVKTDDKTTVVETIHKVDLEQVDAAEDIMDRIESKKMEKEANPPDSLFNKLKPSSNRYTILNDKDEL